MLSDITIITVSYNSADAIRRCQTDLIRGHDGPFLIVDNASPDGSGDTLEREFPMACVLRQDHNLGYGRAANAGLRLVATPFALLINPDIIASPADIGMLADLAHNDPDETVIWAPATEKAKFDPDGGPQLTRHVPGCAMLFHMERLKSLEMFDENIFLYYEETDLCTRADNRGLRIKSCPQVFFDHLGNQSSPPDHATELRKNWHFGWSHVYFHKKHSPRTAFLCCLLYWIRYKRKAMLARDKTARELFDARATGAAKAVLGHPATCAPSFIGRDGPSGPRGQP